jgi:serine/threonine protein kinase
VGRSSKSSAKDSDTAIVMQLLGESLTQLRLRQPNGRFRPSTAMDMCLQMLHAIEACHRAGCVHRDIKPSNFCVGGPPVLHPAVNVLRRTAGLNRYPFGPEVDVEDVLGLRSTAASRSQVFLLDYGLARGVFSKAASRKALAQGADPSGVGAWLERHGEVPREQRVTNQFRGTKSYASVSAHELKDLGRRDDLWSLFYTVVDLATPEGLPWRDVGREQEWASRRRSASAAVNARLDVAGLTTEGGSDPKDKGADAPSLDREAVGELKVKALERPHLLFPKDMPGMDALLRLSDHLKSLDHTSKPDYALVAVAMSEVRDALAGMEEEEEERLWEGWVGQCKAASHPPGGLGADGTKRPMSHRIPPKALASARWAVAPSLDIPPGMFDLRSTPMSCDCCLESRGGSWDAPTAGNGSEFAQVDESGRSSRMVQFVETVEDSDPSGLHAALDEGTPWTREHFETCLFLSMGPSRAHAVMADQDHDEAPAPKRPRDDPSVASPSSKRVLMSRSPSELSRDVCSRSVALLHGAGVDECEALLTEVLARLRRQLSSPSDPLDPAFNTMAMSALALFNACVRDGRLAAVKEGAFSVLATAGSIEDWVSQCESRPPVLNLAPPLDSFESADAAQAVAAPVPEELDPALAQASLAPATPFQTPSCVSRRAAQAVKAALAAGVAASQLVPGAADGGALARSARVLVWQRRLEAITREELLRTAVQHEALLDTAMSSALMLGMGTDPSPSPSDSRGASASSGGAARRPSSLAPTSSSPQRPRPSPASRPMSNGVQPVHPPPQSSSQGRDESRGYHPPGPRHLPTGPHPGPRDGAPPPPRVDRHLPTGPHPGPRDGTPHPQWAEPTRHSAHAAEPALVQRGSGPPIRYDRPLGGYDRPPGGSGGYDRPPGGYDRPPGGYDRPPGGSGGYDRPPGGNDRPLGGYDRPPGGSGGYDRPPGGYDRPPGGYDRPPGGYDRPPGGYDRPPGGSGGYDRPPGGYDRPPGGYDRPPGGSGGYDRPPGGYDRPPGGNDRPLGGYDRPPGGSGGYDRAPSHGPPNRFERPGNSGGYGQTGHRDQSGAARGQYNRPGERQRR